MMPDTVLITAANGQPSARCGETTLFSAYDPRGEALRFVDHALRGIIRPELVLVLGAGLGHLEAAVAAIRPAAVVCSVCYTRVLAVEEGGHIPASVWAPGTTTGMEDFLASNIGERTAETVSVVEWPACARAFPEASRRAREAVLRIFRENAYGALTLAAAGRRWFLNSLVNFIALEPVSGNPLRPDEPLVIAASGPSLSRSLPLLKKIRGGINLWALASSLPALENAGLEPDLVVATDAGYYASTLLDAGRGRIRRLAMPLSAARGAWRTGAEVLYFIQPNFFENELVRLSGLTAPAIDAHGTVAGTALLLARAFGCTAAYFCGLDFCYDDLRSHVRPHAWDALDAARSRRLEPMQHILWSRASSQAPDRQPGSPCRSGASLALYATSFAPICSRLSVARIHASPVPVPGMHEADPADLVRRARPVPGRQPASVLSRPRTYPDMAARRKMVRELLREWMECVTRGLGDPASLAQAGTADAGNLLAECLRFFAGHAPTRPSPGAPDDTAARLERVRIFFAAAERRFAGERAHV
jgi:hypothetical protein